MIKLKQSDTKNVTFIVHMNVTFKLYQSQLQQALRTRSCVLQIFSYS